MNIDIKSQDGIVLLSCDIEGNTLGRTIETAIRNGISLAGSNLSYSNLSYSNLSGSDLRGSDLSYSKLSGSNLSGSDLSGSDLRGSNLSGSNLSGSNLSYSDLRGSNLSGSDLRGSNLSGSNLSGSNLSGSNLSYAVLDDEVLTSAPISISLFWHVMITPKYMKIGCKRHTHAEWRAFSSAEIANMSPKALTFWNTWGATLLAMCDIMASREDR